MSEAERRDSPRATALSIADLSKFIPIITVLGAASVALSFCFEIGYFWMVGTDFLSILTSSDYVHHALLILIILFSICVIGAMPVAYTMVYLKRKIYQLRNTSDHKIRERVGQLKILDFMLGFAVFCFLVYSLSRLIFTEAIIGITITIVLTALSIILRRKFVAFVITSLLVFFSGCSVIFGVHLGYLSLFSNRNIFFIKTTSYSEVKEVSLLRFVDKGVLYLLRAENKIEFTPWSQVKSIYGNADRKPEVPLFDHLHSK